MNKYEKLFWFLTDPKKCDHDIIFADLQVALVARGERGEKLHDDTCSFIASPEFGSDVEQTIKEIALDAFLAGTKGITNKGWQKCEWFEEWWKEYRLLESEKKERIVCPECGGVDVHAPSCPNILIT